MTKQHGSIHIVQGDPEMAAKSVKEAEALGATATYDEHGVATITYPWSDGEPLIIALERQSFDWERGQRLADARHLRGRFLCGARGVTCRAFLGYVGEPEGQPWDPGHEPLVTIRADYHRLRTVRDHAGKLAGYVWIPNDSAPTFAGLRTAPDLGLQVDLRTTRVKNAGVRCPDRMAIIYCAVCRNPNRVSKTQEGLATPSPNAV